MPITKYPGSVFNGKEVSRFALTNAKGTTLTITNYGAIVMALGLTMRDGSVADVVLGFDDPSGYYSPAYRGLPANPYFGAIIGRFANRIAGGHFLLDGNEYHVAKNLPPEHLHGGLEGFDQKVWDVSFFSDEPFPQLGLQCISPAGEEGYPGNLVAQVRYELNDNNEFTIGYAATTDAPTLYNPTNHTYFNLDAKPVSVAEHVLRIASPVVLEQDVHDTPTGNLLRVEGTACDFREAKKVGRDWNPAKGYDQSFVTDSNFQIPAAEIFSPSTGIRMEVFSDAPIVHFYTGAGIRDIPGKNGMVYPAFSGFSLETQLHPNGINLPNFPDAILRPGETFSSRTTYRFTQDPD